LDLSLHAILLLLPPPPPRCPSLSLLLIPCLPHLLTTCYSALSLKHSAFYSHPSGTRCISFRSHRAFIKNNFIRRESCGNETRCSKHNAVPSYSSLDAMLGINSILIPQTSVAGIINRPAPSHAKLHDNLYFVDCFPFRCFTTDTRKKNVQEVRTGHRK
jgi:hypothetical protein